MATGLLKIWERMPKSKMAKKKKNWLNFFLSFWFLRSMVGRDSRSMGIFLCLWVFRSPLSWGCFFIVRRPLYSLSASFFSTYPTKIHVVPNTYSVSCIKTPIHRYEESVTQCVSASRVRAMHTYWNGAPSLFCRLFLSLPLSCASLPPTLLFLNSAASEGGRGREGRDKKAAWVFPSVEAPVLCRHCPRVQADVQVELSGQRTTTTAATKNCHFFAKTFVRRGFVSAPTKTNRKPYFSSNLFVQEVLKLQVRFSPGGVSVSKKDSLTVVSGVFCDPHWQS